LKPECTRERRVPDVVGLSVNVTTVSMSPTIDVLRPEGAEER
jgi:hypothetical protein